MTIDLTIQFSSLYLIMENEKNTLRAYELARSQYSDLGIDTEKAISELTKIPVSINCWQGDDIQGFENKTGQMGDSGILATGNFKGLPRNIDEFRQDIEKSLDLIPGKNRLSLHSIYGEFGDKYVNRNEYENKHFQGWIDWAKDNAVGLDFNSTCFAHDNVIGGFTLANRDKEIRNFWIEHVNRCRDISSFIGKELQNRVIHNIWIPDGSKDNTVSRYYHRSLLKDSLDKIFNNTCNPDYVVDSLESKLFGIGSETYVVGSSEFYIAYAMQNNIMLCMDMGHYHPTESVAEKISSILLFSDELMLHVSRPVRWDSDHVVTYSDELNELCREVARSDSLNRVNFGLDFFDASINRIGAWVIGTRALQKALLGSLLEPVEILGDYEKEGKLFERLALLEELKNKPLGAVWDYYCLQQGVPPGHEYIVEVQDYERRVLDGR